MKMTRRLAFNEALLALEEVEPKLMNKIIGGNVPKVTPTIDGGELDEVIIDGGYYGGSQTGGGTYGGSIPGSEFGGSTNGGFPSGGGSGGGGGAGGGGGTGNNTYDPVMPDYGDIAYHIDLDEVIITVPVDSFEGNFLENYIGPNNPPDYSVPVSNWSDTFAMLHDMEYDNVNAAGVHGVLFDINTLSADLRLVALSASNAAGNFNQGDLKDRFESMGIAVVISGGIMIKLFTNAASQIHN